MTSSATRRAVPCPSSDCPDWAWFASPADISRAAYIWTCRLGHHGPRILGYEEGVR